MNRFPPPSRVLATALACALSTAAAIAVAGASDPKKPAAPKTAPPTSSPAAAKAAPAPPAVRFAPRARQLSTYDLTVRLSTTTRDVTFEAPPAYQESFAFWSNRMKGQMKSEIFDFVTSTEEQAPDGSMKARRTIPKFNVEMERNGQPMVPYGPLEKTVTGFMWEATMDPLGNLRDLRQVAGKPSEETALLSFPHAEATFPVVEAARDMRPGDAFTEVVTLPLPSKLSIAGLEATQMRVAREFRLKQATGGEAKFEVIVRYEGDPSTPPTAPGTSCRISGSGTGEATFDLKRGVFTGLQQKGSLLIDIEAPLRRLPDQPPDFDPGKARSHITVDVDLFARQVVRRLWGQEED